MKTNKLAKPLSRLRPFLISVSILTGTNVIAMQESTDTKARDDSRMEYIEITADLSQRNLSELPTTAIILGQELIQKRQARHLQDLVNIVPNLNFSAGASRGKFVQIRGIGERSQFAEPINPSIGIMLDDIDISGIGGLATVHDLQQVEVLSGPQSIATGLNSLGGIVKLVSNSAEQNEYVNASASYAQYNEHRIAGVYNNALTKNASARFNLQNTQSDGFVKNAFLGTDDSNGINELTASARFHIAVNKSSRLNINLYHFDIENGYDAFSLDNDNITQSDEPGFDNIDAQAASIKYSHDFVAHSLQVGLSGINADTEYGYDEDWTFPAFHPSSYSAFDLYTRKIERRALDIKFASITDQNTSSSYLLGINILKHEENSQRIYTFAADYSSRYKPNSNSLFGLYEMSLSDSLGVTIAARAEQFSADFFDNQRLLTSIDDNLFAASVAFDYQLADNLVYATISRGYKAGGFNIDQRLTPNSRAFKPEFNYNYELGIKGEAYQGMAKLNLTFFYMQREDAQVSDFVVFKETLNDGSVVSSFADAIGNADSGINKGVELSSTWDISDNFYLSANLGYLDASFGNYTKIDGTQVPKQAQAQAPKYTAYLSSNWRISNNVNWFVDVDIKDEHRFSDGHDELAPFTAVLNSELTWKLHPFEISLWVKNVFDRKILTRGFGGFSNDPRDEYSFSEAYYQFGQARQIGVTFTYSAG